MDAQARPNYAMWTAVLLGLDAALWWVLRQAGVGADATPQVLLLLDTLVVLAWYAHLTYEVASTSQRQFELAERSFESANRPCVVVEWRHTPAPGPGVAPGWTYVAKNIGPGLAVTMVWISDLEAREPEVLHLGAIEPGGAIELPEQLVKGLNDERRDPINRQHHHVIIAEPLAGGLWTLSRNLMEATGRLSHQITTMTITEQRRQQIHRETLEVYVHRNWQAIRADLQARLRAPEEDEPENP